MNPIRKFYIKHPKFRRIMDTIEFWVNWANIFSYAIIFIFVLFIILFSYESLPEDIKTTATAIIGGLLSISVFPLIIDCINKRTEIQNARFERLHDFYIDLCKRIITALKTEKRDDIKEVSDFIKENYHIVCIDVPQKLKVNLMALKQECDIKNSSNVNAKFDINTFAYFAEKSIRIIRKQGNVEGSFFFDNSLTNKNGADL